MNRRTSTKDRGRSAAGGPKDMTDERPALDHSSSTRVERFERDLADIGHRTSRADRTLALAGAAVMALGVVLAVAAYAMSTGQSDTRDVISSGILATVGLSIVLAGAAVFVRGSLTEFLRFWMLRLLAEQRHDTHREP